MNIYINKETKNIIFSKSDELKLEGYTLLKANTVDAALEKHVPSVSINNNVLDVVVGSVVHPMLENHYIEFIAVETESGFMVKYLKPNEEPKASFVLNDKAIAVYEYCNLHGLWKKEL
jgi:superoxide reductase